MGKDRDHAQAIRHAKESADANLALQRAQNDEEVRRTDELKKVLGADDVTKLLCVQADRTPDQHLRIDSVQPTQLHLEMLKNGGNGARARGVSEGVDTQLHLGEAEGGSGC